MNKVQLSMVRSGEYRIEAETFVNGQADNRKGNVDTIRGRKLEWSAQSDLNVLRYVVTFKSLDDDSTTWPFKEQANGQGTAGPGYTGPLVITPGSVIKLTTKKSDPPVKYDVTAERSDLKSVDKLDPMIIIRPGLRSIIEAGLPWAVAGAAVGALVTAVALME